MRLSVKVAFAVLAGLAISQIYTNYGSLLYTKIRNPQPEGVVVNLKTQGEHFVFSLPGKTASSSTPRPSVTQGKPLSVAVKNHVGSLSSSQLENGTLPLSAFWKDLDFLLKNQTFSPISQPYNTSTAKGSDNPATPLLQDSRLMATLQSYFKNLSYSDLQQLLAQYFNLAVPQKIAAGLGEKSGDDSGASQGVIVQQGSKLLLSSVRGKVKLPVVNSSTAGVKLPPCPDKPPNLGGLRTPVIVSQNVSDLEVRFSSFLNAGGDYHPKECLPEQRVALIIPYRNRWDHLHVLLNNLIPFMVRQQVSFSIFVIEQMPPSTFNRALLLNIGILEASLRDLYTCFILHDVDLIPLHDENLYRCSQQPKHFAVGINKFKYRLPYGTYFGGVTGLSREHVEKINGNSNLYFGWGGEDDELLYRVRAKGMKVVRLPPQIARYDMFKHGRDHGNEANPVRFNLLKSTSERMEEDGLNSLRYNVTSVEVKPLYTWIKIAVNPRLYAETAPAIVNKLLKSSMLK